MKFGYNSDLFTIVVYLSESFNKLFNESNNLKENK